VRRFEYVRPGCRSDPRTPLRTFSDSNTRQERFTSPPSRKTTPRTHVGEYRIET